MDAPPKAMVLAAGFGRRMRPLTATAPKPLIAVAGKALIDHCLDGLDRAGVTTAVINVHYLPDLIEAHLARRARPRMIISDERARLMDTGGAIVQALPLLGREPFLLRNADSFWIEGVRPNLTRLFEAWEPERMDALLLLASTVGSAGYEGRGDFFLSRTGRLTRRGERLVAPFAYAGAAMVHPRLFEGAPEGPFSLNLLLDAAIEAERLYGLRLDGLWIDVETPTAIAAAESAIEESAA